jgi:hypothetical protein
MRGAIPPLPRYASMAWCLVKHRDKFTFLPLPILQTFVILQLCSVTANQRVRAARTNRIFKSIFLSELYINVASFLSLLVGSHHFRII